MERDSTLKYKIIIGCLVLVIVGILIYFLVYKKPAPDCPAPECPAPECPAPDCPKNTIFGFSIKPGNEILDFANEIEDEFKPLIHGVLCSIIDKLVSKTFRDKPDDMKLKCSEVAKMIEEMKANSLEFYKSEENNPIKQFSDKHKIFDFIKEKLENLYDKLYKKYCKSETDNITVKDIKMMIEGFKNNACDSVEFIDISIFDR